MSRRINPYKKFNCSLIPEWMECRKSSEISDGAKLVYARLTRFCGDNGECFPKLEVLGEKVGKSLAQVKRCVKELKELKLIESIQIGKKCSNRYYFLEHPWMNEGVYIEDEGSDSSHMSSHSNSDSSHMTLPMDGSHVSCPQKENQERESKYISHDFKNRWKEYSFPFESKSKLGDSDNKLNRLSPKEYEFLLQQRDKYIAYVKSKRKSWKDFPMKNASTFLNKKYWKNAEWVCENKKNNTFSIYDLTGG